MKNSEKSKKYQGWFSTESVSEGHPDKIADQIAEGVLDYVSQKDSESHVACEVFVMNKKILIGGEIKTTQQQILKNIQKDLVKLTKKIIKKDIKFLENDWKNLQKLNIETIIQVQSKEVDKKVSINKSKVGAGDNSTVYGWAENSPNSEYIPPYQYLSHLILKKINNFRKTNNSQFNFSPDGKIQILLKDKKLNRITLCQQFNYLISEQKKQSVSEKIKKEIIIPLIKKTFNEVQDFCFIFIPFHEGGPIADTGLTGRKITVDNYGTFVRHGGGSFAGKDITKTDRSLALFARFIAKNIIKLKLASAIEIQITSRIGQFKDFYIGYLAADGDNQKIKKIIKYFSSWTFKKIIETLNLKKVTFQKYAAYGYFGRKKKDAYWEKNFLIFELKKIIK